MHYLLWVTLVGLLAESCSGERPHPHPHPHPHPTHHPHPPHPCKSPPELQGSLTVAAASGDYFLFGKYIYDAIGQRIRFGDFGQYKNETFHDDVLLLYKEGVMYRINKKNQTCTKKELSDTFHPMEIPANATLLGQVILGSFSGPGEGLLVNSWSGEIPASDATYFLTFTEFGCLPISSSYHTPQTGWIVTSYFNIIVGIKDPSPLTPPPFCKNATMERGENGNFFSAFL
ncbi:hypothetical protein MHYP_G00119390 [Metynnis hypsauchen]